MQTFSLLSQSIILGDLTRKELLNSYIFRYNIHERINRRGDFEQYASLLLTHMFPNENIVKRKCKGTFTSGAEIFTKYKLNF